MSLHSALPDRHVTCKTQGALWVKSEATATLKLMLCGCRVTVTTTLCCALSHSSLKMKIGGRTRPCPQNNQQSLQNLHTNTELMLSPPVGERILISF